MTDVPRYLIAEAIRINLVPEHHRRDAMQALPLESRTPIAAIAKQLRTSPRPSNHDLHRESRA